MEYNEVREEFMEAFEHEEKLQRKKEGVPRARTMRRVWETGSFFYFNALDSPTGLFHLWGQHIQPKFTQLNSNNDEQNRVLAPYWSMDAENVVAAKIKEREAYIEQLGDMFEDNTQISPS